MAKALTTKVKRKIRIQQAVGAHFLGFGFYFAIQLGVFALSVLLSKNFHTSIRLFVAPESFEKALWLPNLYAPVHNEVIGLLIMMSVPFCAAVASSWLLYCAGMQDKEKDRIVSVTLISTDSFMKSLLDALAGRHQIFKNSIRNWPELQAVYIFSMYVMASAFLVNAGWLLSLLGAEPLSLGNFWFTFAQELLGLKLLTLPAIAGPLMVIYAYLKKDYGDKWQYCADLQNKIEFSGPGVVGDRAHVALAIDLMNLDLWSKRSFCRFFFKEVRHAIQTSSESVDWKNKKMKQLGQHGLSASAIEELLNARLHGTLRQETHLRKVG